MQPKNRILVNSALLLVLMLSLGAAYYMIGWKGGFGHQGLAPLLCFAAYNAWKLTHVARFLAAAKKLPERESGQALCEEELWRKYREHTAERQDMAPIRSHLDYVGWLEKKQTSHALSAVAMTCWVAAGASMRESELLWSLTILCACPALFFSFMSIRSAR